MAMSARAMEFLRARTTPSRSWYLDLKLIHDYSTVSHRYHHTAPISMFYALREALRVIAEEGIENRWERHRRCNNVFVPAGVDEAKVRKHLLDGPGIEIAGGFGPLADKVFRIGVMGPLATEDNVQFFLKEFKKALSTEAYSL